MKFKTRVKSMRNIIFYSIIEALILCIVFLSTIAIIYKNAEDAGYESLHIHTKEIKDNLYLRTRRPGDSYRSRGITKSLKKMMNERKTDLSLRDRLPVICDGEGIIWVPGFPVCDRVYPDENEKKTAATVLVAFYR